MSVLKEENSEITDDRIEKVKREIITLSEENKSIALEIDHLNQEIKLRVKTDDFMNKFTKKIEIWGKLIDEVAKKEEVQIRKLIKEKESNLDNKIDEIDSKIKNIQYELGDTIEDIIEKNEVLDKEIDNIIGIPDIITGAQKDQKNDDQSVAHSLELSLNEELENKNANKSINVERIEITSEAPSSGFWSNNTDEIVNAKESQSNIIKINEIKRNNKVDSVEKSEIKNEMKSKAIENEISDVRARYLIGKIVGKDLVDESGKVIIAENSKITEDTIKCFQDKGKLPELIVNMKGANENA